MKNISINFKLFYFVLFLTILACEKDDPVIINDEEVITTVIYTLTPESSGNTITLSFQDLDGDGGQAPVLTGASLNPNTTYNARITLLNESTTPTLDITDEIRLEDEDHQFFYTISDANASIVYTDADSDGNPIGLSTQLTTGASSMGSINITLRHEPNKSASGVSSGDVTNAGGETDISITLDLNIL
jgi:hypothetical protein